METVRTLIKAGHADVNHETRAGKTPLIEAARHGRTAVVRVLMEHRAVIPYKNRRGQTAAWWAKRLGHRDCLMPMAREIKAEATLRVMSSQIGRAREQAGAMADRHEAGPGQGGGESKGGEAIGGGKRRAVAWSCFTLLARLHRLSERVVSCWLAAVLNNY